MNYIKIYPDYSHKQLCHFRKNQEAVPGAEIKHSLYYISNVDFGLISTDYSYHMVEVGVPSSNKAGKLDLWKSAFQLLVTLAFFAGGIYVFAIMLHLDVYMAMFISLIVALMALWGFSTIFNKIFSFHSDIVDYAPIKKLIEFGFVVIDHKPTANEVDAFKMNKPLDQEAFKVLLKDICEHDFCVITK